MPKYITFLKKVTSLILCFIILISGLVIATKPAFAEFNRGTAKSGYFDKGKVILDRPFKQPDGYIRKRELRNLTPLNPKVNLYDKHEEKIGFAKKSFRRDGFDIYDKCGNKTGFYRNTFPSSQY
jgi:hypothetical protein